MNLEGAGFSMSWRLMIISWKEMFRISSRIWSSSRISRVRLRRFSASCRILSAFSAFSSLAASMNSWSLSGFGIPESGLEPDSGPRNEWRDIISEDERSLFSEMNFKSGFVTISEE